MKLTLGYETYVGIWNVRVCWDNEDLLGYGTYVGIMDMCWDMACMLGYGLCVQIWTVY